MQQISTLTGGFVNTHLLEDLASLPSVRGISDALGFTDTDTHGMGWMEEMDYHITHFATQAAVVFYESEINVAKAGSWAVSKVGALFESGGEEDARLVSSIKRVSSNVANKPFISEEATARGWKPPYPDNVNIREITLAQETRFVRVFTGEDPTGQFITRYVWCETKK